MYKAKYNIVCGDKNFEQGKTYTADEIVGVDVNDFDVVGEPAPVAPEAPKEATEEAPTAPSEPAPETPADTPVDAEADKA